MSNKDKALVHNIVQEILRTTNFQANHCYEQVHGQKKAGYFLTDGGKCTGHYNDLESLIGSVGNEPIWMLVLLKMAKLKPETLGRIIATGVNGTNSQRTAMSAVWEIRGEELVMDTHSGKLMLTRIAAVVVTAAIWDVLRKNIKETTCEEH